MSFLRPSAYPAVGILWPHVGSLKVRANARGREIALNWRLHSDLSPRTGYRPGRLCFCLAGAPAILAADPATVSYPRHTYCFGAMGNGLFRRDVGRRSVFFRTTVRLGQRIVLCAAYAQYMGVARLQRCLAPKLSYARGRLLDGRRLPTSWSSNSFPLDRV